MNFLDLCARVLGPALAVVFILGYLAIGALLLSLVACSAPVPEHPVEREPALWTCFVPETTMRVLGMQYVTVGGHRMMGMATDRNTDDQFDLLMLYDVDDDGGPSPYPRYYFIDDNWDTIPDRAFEDQRQNGRCGDMQSIGVDHFATRAQL